MKRLLFALVIVLSARQGFAQGEVVQTLNELRPLYPTPMSKPQVAELLNKAAQAHPGWMMLRKEAGNNCPTPSGKHISCDWLVNTAIQWGYDMLRDQEGIGQPGVFGDGAIAPGTELVLPWETDAPAPPVNTPPQTPAQPPQPPAQTFNLQPALDRIAAAEASVLLRIAEAEGDTMRRFDQIDKKVDDFREAVRSKWVAAMAFAAKYLAAPIAAAFGAWQMTK